MNLKTTSFLTTIMLFSIVIQGQTSFQILSDLSTKVIEGRVIERTSFRSQEDGHIYTRNIIETLKVFKGDNEESLEIITSGGIFDSEEQYWSHSFDLSLNRNGIFFLTESPLFSDTYIPVSDIEGFISFRDYTGYDLFGYGHKKVYKNLTKKIYNPLKELHGEPRILKLNEHESELLQTQISIGGSDCVEYIIRNLEITQPNNLQNINNYSIDFDIDIRSLNQLFQLRKSEITMEYSTSLLGQNVVSSNNIIASLGGDFQNYDISLSDAASNKVKIDITKIIGQIAYDVNTFQSKIYHASIIIQNFDLSALLSLTVDENFDLKTFKEDGSNPPVEIACNQYNEDINITLGQLLPAEITSYNPIVYAGTKTLLTIEGTNLTAQGGSTEIWFRNANKGNIENWVKPLGSSYQLLSTDKIEVYVPSKAVDALDGTTQDKEYAGTGKFRLVHKINGDNNIEEEKDLTVVYAVKNTSDNSVTQPILLTKGRNTDSYIITYTSTFSSLQDNQGFYFKDAFQRALDTWCNTTGLNYVVDEDALQTGNYDMLVDYGIINSLSTLAATAIPNLYNSNCPIELFNGSPNHPETHEVDFIDNNITIKFNSALPVTGFCAEQLTNTDFLTSVEQIALHEIGHAHGILHTNHVGELMYFAAGSAYTITSEASSASNYLQGHSDSHNCANGTYSVRTDCTTGTTLLNNDKQIHSWYSDKQIIVSSNDLSSIDRINIYSTEGKLLKSVENNEQNQLKIPFEATNGIYVVSYISKSKIYSDKLLVK